MSLEIAKSHLASKKYDAIYTYNNIKKIIPFGAAGYSDYTINKDKRRRQMYIDRHRRLGEDWGNPITAGSLSRWILWGDSTNIDENIKNFKRKFKLS